MSALLVPSIALSLAALTVLLALERRDERGQAALIRLALALLLIHPALAWLPKWHVLPDVAVAAGTAAALPSPALSGWLWLWLGGVTVQILRLGKALGRLAAWRRNSLPLEHADDLALAAECARVLGLRRRVALLVSAQTSGAAACGLWRPVVLLPPDWRDWPPETKCAVLLHELGHHASWDPLWRTVSLVAAALHWFNPLVWWLALRLQRQAEFVCDARVVGSGFRRERYAHILCDLASRGPAAALALAAPAGLEQRVRRLQRSRGSVAPLLVGAAAAALAACALAIAVLRPAKPAPAAPAAAPASQPAYSAEELATRRHANPFPED
jgi:beta-lactamase regulating signal transducer with metallopeptidase domain